MNKNLRLSFSMYCCWITFLVNPVFSQPTLQTKSIIEVHRRLLDLHRQVLTISKDLSQLQKALGVRDPEWSTSLSLVAGCEKTLAYIWHAMDVLLLYQNMSSAKDRGNVRQDVEGSLRDLVKVLELEIEVVNNAIAYTNKPGIASTATEFRNAIRQVIDALKAVRL